MLPIRPPELTPNASSPTFLYFLNIVQSGFLVKERVSAD